MVKLYPALTHDDIYKKPLNEVIALDDLNRRQAYISAKMAEERRKQNE